MRIAIEVVPHKEQRYPTVGDWYFENDGTLSIKVSSMRNEYYEILVAIHELIEVYICKKRNLSEETVTNFDIAFEEVRANFPEVIGDEEPGDMVSAPYHEEHIFATMIEKLIANELGVDWNKYEKKVNSL